jgi:hypothetical protein
MTEVLRSAIAEVEQYSRVKLVPPIDGTLRGHAVADVIHLLAELVENATLFSAPHTQVLLRANLVTSGLAVEVEDRGLGMPVGEQKKMNALLADPDQVNVASLLADGRIGLFVVSQLARRHGIHVRLQSNIYGGVQAVLVVPQGLLGASPGVPGSAPQPQGTVGPTGAPGPSVPPRAAYPQVPPAPEPGSRLAVPEPHAPRHAQQPADGARAMDATRAMDAGRGMDATRSIDEAQAMSATGPNGANGAAQNAVTHNGVAGNGVAQNGVPQNAVTPNGAAQNVVAHHGQSRNGLSQDGAAHYGVSPAGAPGTAAPANGVPLHASVPAHRSSSGAAPADGGAPAPLPVRGPHEERANPAEALPGIRADERPLLADTTADPNVPRTGPVRGTMGRPQLPRRRAQEHIAPQLRDGPAPRQEADHLAGHDPGLMAAFQRGIGLAETQQALEPGHTKTGPASAGHTDPALTGAGHTDPPPTPSQHPVVPGRMEPDHRAPGHADPGRTGPGHMDSGHTGPSRMDSGHTGPGHMEPGPTGPSHMESGPTAPPSHLEAVRRDGSAPEG